jgi:hypothetical protein
MEEDRLVLELVILQAQCHSGPDRYLLAGVHFGNGPPDLPAPGLVHYVQIRRFTNAGRSLTVLGWAGL